MGQGYSLTTLSAGSAGIDVPELSDLVYEKSLGSARFMKCIRARQQNGLAVVKVIMKPYPSMKLDPYVKAIIRERELLAGVPNALAYQRIIETGTSGYLVRQYIYSSLYDRMSTRPFLEDIEKKWIAFQLLCALRDCHAQDVFHGDIKTENVLVTSWNWLYLSDFSSSFKPTFLPEDNPADFSFYFDTSGRRTCYLAPERFLVAGEDPGNRRVNWAMDIFSAGCVIAELFLESPIFTLSQLYKYRKGEFSPEHSHLTKIEDQNIRELVLHMIQIDPESRYSAEEYLNFWRHKAFPDYFYSFLHQYMSLITEPASGRAHIDAETGNMGESDDRIDRIYLDFDKISYFLGSTSRNSKDGSKLTTPRLTSHALPVHLDIPNYRHETSNLEPQDGALIFLTVVVANIRNTAKASARVKACDLLLAFAERVPDEAKLDRILPYVIILLNDRSDIVKVAAIRTLAQLLSMVQVVSPVNAYLFPEYIFPRLQPFIPSSNSNPSPMVRAAYASCIASLAQSSLRFLDMIQALRTDTRLPSLIPAGSEANWTEDATYHNLYDVARVDLLDYFELHTKALLTDSDPSVRRAFLGSVSSLCVFFGNQKTNEVILSHLNTYLNDKDWILKCAFFEAVVGVAAYVGSTSLEEFILPLMVQSMTDSEEFVVERVLRSLAAMADLGLFQRSTTWELLHMVVRFFVHPSLWIREAAVFFVVTSAKFLSFADKHSILTPLIRPFLKNNITSISEGEILDALKRPMPKNIYDMALVWASKAEKGNFWKSASRDGTFSLGGAEVHIGRGSPRSTNTSLTGLPRNEEDEQWLSRLRNLGMTPDDEFKLLALREYIWRVAVRLSKNADLGTSTPLNSIITLTQYGVTPQTVFFDKNQAVKQRRASLDNLNVADQGERRPHTIADALLDASTTIDTPAAARRKHMRSRSQRSRESGSGPQVPVPNALEAIKTDSQTPSSMSSSPTAQNASAQTSDVERRTASRIQGADKNSERGSIVTLTDGENPMSAGSGQRKPSAISLLNRKDMAKAYAETSTTSTNAFGKVDIPSQRETPLQSPLSMARERPAQQTVPQQYHVGHSYSGNDPMILKLLDSVFAENYPTDLFDLGPYVKELDSRRPIKKASGENGDKPWRPEGVLVAMFGEHTGPVNRVVVAPDHAFFVTASDDGTVKVWDTTRLEKNLTPRSRQTHRHAAGSKVKCLTFVENTYTFVSGATDGSIHAVKVDYHNVNETVRYGKPQIVRQYQLPQADDGSVEYATWIEHFRSEAQSTLLVATNTCRILAIDMKTMLPVYSLQNPVHHGTPTAFCYDRKHSWLLVGTSHGILDLWDLRFRVRLKAWGLPGGTSIHRLQVHPTKGRGRWVCVAGGSAHGSEITVWDVEKVQCREVYRAASPSVSAAHAPAPNGNPHSHRSPIVNNLTAMNTVSKSYEPWRVDEDRPEGMLSRFATASSAGIEPNTTASSSPTGAVDRNGICALAVGLEMPEDGKDSAKCGFAISAGSDRKVRFWDLARPELSTIVSGLDTGADGAVAAKPRYETVQPTPNLVVTTEHMPNVAVASGRPGGGRKGASGSGGGRLPRSTVISLQQQQLLKSHLDSILDVAVLRVPYGMTVSVDRAGMVYVFQ
ncbi:hypothetical protein VTN77DRAFT_421 [Rasamsonia byssochlamydoides]|uniref:uncharacterized protein n=1 Tax=Rasamsonia byssochlamydoides TaxID=89139 RepID=UPI003742B0A6